MYVFTQLNFMLYTIDQKVNEPMFLKSLWKNIRVIEGNWKKMGPKATHCSCY